MSYRSELKLSDEEQKKIAEQLEKRDVILKQYREAHPPTKTESHELHPAQADLIARAREDKKPQKWTTFKLHDNVTISGREASVSCITPKDIVLVLNDGDEPPVKRGDVVEINGHQFRVRNARWSMITIRPLLGTTRQYV